MVQIRLVQERPAVPVVAEVGDGCEDPGRRYGERGQGGVWCVPVPETMGVILFAELCFCGCMRSEDLPPRKCLDRTTNTEKSSNEKCWRVFDLPQMQQTGEGVILQILVISC